MLRKNSWVRKAMCEIYSGAEEQLFELKSRSVRIDGVVIRAC
ncbi:hypothetical protein [Vibrio sp. M250220]